MTLAGNHVAGVDLTATAGGGLAALGGIEAGGTATLRANGGTLAQRGTVSAGTAVLAAGGNLDQAGTVAAGGDASLSAGGNLTNGGTVVAGGTLLVNGTNAFASVTVSANSGATLGGAGRVGGASGYTNANVPRAGSTNLAGGATLFPGTVDASTGEHVIGTFTVGGPAQANHVTFGAYSTLRITVSTNGRCDRRVVYGTLSLATATDRLAIVQAEAGELPAGTYSLASFQQLAAEGQTFDTVTGLPERGKLVYSSTGIELVVTAPPPKGTVLSLF
jgi:adhesin HecA-like repeat protein